MENESIGRKKLLLSIAKLSNLAESISTPVSKLNWKSCANKFPQPDLTLEQKMYMLRIQKTILPTQVRNAYTCGNF